MRGRGWAFVYTRGAEPRTWHAADRRTGRYVGRIREVLPHLWSAELDERHPTGLVFHTRESAARWLADQLPQAREGT